MPALETNWSAGTSASPRSPTLHRMRWTVPVLTWTCGCLCVNLDTHNPLLIAMSLVGFGLACLVVTTERDLPED